MSSNSNLLSLVLFTLLFASVAQATVPASDTFKFINQGDLGEYFPEDGADYRPTDLYSFPFTLCFYKDTPNTFILGLLMGVYASQSVQRWVWDANRGNPVREGATLTFGSDGNLVLADVDGRIAWQTGTANKGVVGLSLLSNGNLVLYNKKNKFVWQSFDYPSDTLLIGQSLRLGGPNKLVSRVSDDGTVYSLELEKTTLALYLKRKNSPSPILYYRYQGYGPENETLSTVQFNFEPEYHGTDSYVIFFGLQVRNESVITRILGRPKYDCHLSFIRINQDGSLMVYTYYDRVDWVAWEITYSLFDRERLYGISECKLPSRCGSFGVCEDNNCVACPKPQGLLGWSKECVPPRLPPCKGGVSINAKYYKVAGVEHFMNEYNEGEGPMKMSQCRDKCSKDCGCLGIFYREESSKCLAVPVLGTLSKVANRSHVAYIKTR